MAAQQLGIVIAAHQDLIGKAPEENGGMVIILGRHFPDLIDRRRMGVVIPGGGKIRDLRPDTEPQFIAGIVNIMALLVVGQTDGVRAHFRNDPGVFVMVFFRKGIALIQPVLVTADAPQVIAASVQEKALLCIQGEVPDAEAGLHLVQHFVEVHQLQPGGIEVSTVCAVPEPGRGDRRFQDHLIFNGGPGFRYGFFLCVKDLQPHLHAGFCICQESPDTDAGMAVFYFRIDEYAGTAVIVQ